MRVFLSHNKRDKDVARRLGAHLVLAGADVWFDEWEVAAGDSIIGKLNEGLADFDVFVLLWSIHAQRSDWVRRELEAAIHRTIVTRSAKVIPCLLDDTPLPPLLKDLRHVDFGDPGAAIDPLVGDLMGLSSRGARLKAIQAALNEMDLQWHFVPTMPPLLCCPSCGRTDSIEPWSATDDRRGDSYAGLRCKHCGWEDGGEL